MRSRILRELLRMMPDDVLLLSYSHLSEKIPSLIYDFKTHKDESILGEIGERVIDFKKICREMKKRNLLVTHSFKDLKFDPFFLKI